VERCLACEADSVGTLGLTAPRSTLPTRPVTAISALALVDSVPRKAGSRARTDDLLITNQLLYQLSYAGILAKLKPEINGVSTRAQTVFWLHFTAATCSNRCPSGIQVRKK
jgi:hypothetical protein